MLETTGVDSISYEVVSAVAEAKDTSHTELTPLSEVIDPDALDHLFYPESEALVQIEYEGFTVIIDPDKNITLQE